MDNMDFTYMDHLHELPRFKAPNRVWERLEVSMITVDADALPTFSPSTALWNRLEKKLIIRRTIYRSALAVLLILAISIPAYFILFSSIAPGRTDGNVNQQTKIGTTNVSDPQNKNATVVVMDEPTAPVEKFEVAESISSVVPNQSGQSHQSVQSAQSTHPFQSIESTITKAPPNKSIELGFLKMKEGHVIINMVPEMKERDRFDACRSFYGSTNSFSWGPSYEYQYFLEGDTYLDTEQKYWQSASINGELCFGKFFLETGLGITLARDKTPYAYDFMKYEHINTYEYVDSVHYDPTTGETTYYISYVDVYDSVSYTKSETVEKSYSYLKIPFFAGLQLFENQKFSTSISGGVIYNLLISKNSTDISLSEPNARITEVRFRETTRVKNNFSLSLHLNFEWELNDGLDLYFYPSFNYYLNPLYDGDIEAQPMSVGVGIGLWIK